MKFGKVDTPDAIDFSIPTDHPATAAVLKSKEQRELIAYVGCAKWNRQDLKGFYPRGTKDELGYYSTQFNCVEMNATFYCMYPGEQFTKWYEKTPDDFKFFPKLTQDISHFKRLDDSVYSLVDSFVGAASNLKEKLGTIFLQMHSNFGPKHFDRVKTFIENWPKQYALAVEFRHKDWFSDEKVANELCSLLEDNGIANVLVDTAGRRDLMHMRLTNGEAFIRYVGANHASDYSRLDDWVGRLKIWREQGLSKIHFFVHQNVEVESPLLTAHFVKQINEEFGLKLTVPAIATEDPQGGLF